MRAQVFVLEESERIGKYWKGTRNLSPDDWYGLMEEYASFKTKELEEALTEIAKGEGAYDMDKLKHASNTIENMKAIANKMINPAQ